MKSWEEKKRNPTGGGGWTSQKSFCSAGLCNEGSKPQLRTVVRAGVLQAAPPEQEILSQHVFRYVYSRGRNTPKKQQTNGFSH